MKMRIMTVFVALTLLLLPAVVSASHSWRDYHWARTASPFTLQVVDSMTADWDVYRVLVSDDWTKSSVLDLRHSEGSDLQKDRKTCKAIFGKLIACNAVYGFNGWLGVATIWVSSGHIVQATSKVNDSYFNTLKYNDPNAKRHVLCQEVGHTLGLGHQTGVSCMDDRNGLFDSAYVSPNAHDYEQLATIYGSHPDTSSTVAATAAAAFGRGGNDAGADDDFGPVVEKQGRTTIHVKDLGGGLKRITFVIWADPGKP